MSDHGGHDADSTVIGSGFGGSVSALWLAEKGCRVAGGSVASANPGVDPSLTITALAKFVMSRVPPLPTA